MITFFSYLFYFIAASISPLQRRWLINNKEYTVREQIIFTFQRILILFLGSLTFPFFSRFYLDSNYYHLFLLALVCGLFGASGNILQYLGQKHLDAGVMSIVGNIYTPVTIVLSSVLLYEGLTPLQIVGTILLLVAIVIVSKKHHINGFRFDKYFFLVFLSGVLIGVLLVAERALQKATGFSAGVMISWGSQAFALGLVALFFGKKHTYTNKEVVTTGVLQFLQATSYVTLLFVVGNLSFVSSITTFKVVIIFIAAAIFLKEREDLRRKIFGSIIAVLGLLLMK